jgi:DNA-binding SARP family transcriptional activator
LRRAHSVLQTVEMTEFRLLGPLEVDGPGGPVALGGQKQRAVLAFLLLNAGRVVSTDSLVNALWGESPPRTAGTSLQNFVSGLRKALGPETLVTRAPGYVLRADPDLIDLERFQRLRQDALGQAPERRAEILRGALELWRGEALADFRYEPWAATEAARLDELRLATVEERIDAELELGRHSDLAGELEALVAHHPLRERLCGQLMLALYRSGRQAEALEVYQATRRALVDELGIEPGPALQQLNGAILRQEISLTPVGVGAPAEDHFEEVLKAVVSGRLVPVLGSDVGELAAILARHFAYPGDAAELTRVSQYIAVMKGPGPLWDELHDLLETPVQPTPIHRFFASLPALLRERGAPHQLIVTTSYDLALEQALLDAGEEFDVVSYIASGRHRGRFCHLAPDGTAAPIELPNTYASELSLERRTIILKLHGRYDPSPGREWESFVITEDDYIEYLAQSDVSTSVPVGLAAKLQRSHFLFLGYTMADWNLRVVLKRLWGDNRLSYRSWAVQAEAKPLEREFWRRLDVDVLELPLDEYVERLGRHLVVTAPA